MASMTPSPLPSTWDGSKQQDTFSWLDLWVLIRRYWVWLIALPLAGALGGFLGSHLQTPIWEARTQVLITRSVSVTDANADLTAYFDLRDLLETYKEILSQDWVREEISRRLDGYLIDEDQLKISVPTKGLVLDIRAQDPNPERAKAIADLAVQILIEQHQALQLSKYEAEEERLTAQLAQVQRTIEDLQEELQRAMKSGDQGKIAQLERELELYQQMYLRLLDRREAVRLQRLYSVPNILQVRPAEVSDEPVKPKILLNVAAGGLAGLMVAGGYIFLREVFNPTVRHEQEVRQLLPVLATIVELEEAWPEGEGPYVLQHPRSPYTESFRVLRSNLEFFQALGPQQVLLITSVGPGERKTTLSVNLAAIYAQSGRRVLLIDVDMRRPRVHRVLGIARRVGLSTLFRAPLKLEHVLQRWDDSSLYVVTAGGIPPNPTELLQSPRMREILQEARSQFDVIVLDAPPLVFADPYVLAPMVDGVLLSVRVELTHRVGLVRVVEQLQQNPDVRLLGAVVFVPPRAVDRYGYYYNHYYYAYTLEEQESQA